MAPYYIHDHKIPGKIINESDYLTPLVKRVIPLKLFNSTADKSETSSTPSSAQSMSSMLSLTSDTSPISSITSKVTHYAFIVH